jgi:hypothetical protein
MYLIFCREPLSPLGCLDRSHVTIPDIYCTQITRIEHPKNPKFLGTVRLEFH